MHISAYIYRDTCIHLWVNIFHSYWMLHLTAGHLYGILWISVNRPLWRAFLLMLGIINCGYNIMHSAWTSSWKFYRASTLLLYAIFYLQGILFRLRLENDTTQFEWSERGNFVAPVRSLRLECAAAVRGTVRADGAQSFNRDTDHMKSSLGKCKFNA